MKRNKLYLISQTENTGYDTYDSAVVCAPNEEAARNTHPEGCGEPVDFTDKYDVSTWCSSADKVEVSLLGNASPDIPVGVVCSSFNAG